MDLVVELGGEDTGDEFILYSILFSKTFSFLQLYIYLFISGAKS